MKAFVATFVIITLIVPANAQQMPLTVQRPGTPIPIRSYQPAIVLPVRLANSGRIYKLIRGNKLYLTVQDALVLAIENNLDLEMDRYGPLLAEWQLERAEGGGPLRGVPSGSAQVGQVASGQGVSGSQSSAGL